MRIEELHLKNFRCFKELDIKFSESNLAVFIGLNGSGKTAILDAIISSLLNLNKHHGIIKHINSELFSDDDISIDANELNTNVKISCNSYSASWSILKEKDNAQKIDIEGDASEFEKKIMETPNFTISQYTAKREKKFVHQGYPNLVTIDFDVFKKRFIEEVDAENRIIIEKKDFTCTNPKLNVIRKAIEVFCSKISNMCISNLRTKDIKENTNIVMDWDGLELSLSQLSEGQRNLLLLISDIAFSLLNPMGSWTDREKSSEDILNRNGIVLIDEIELHLHPQWQREVMPALQETFRNIQFIITTHSPQVLSRVHKDDIFILNNNKIHKPSSNPIGRDANDILEEIMEVTKRPKEIQELSDKYFSLINKSLLDEAQEIRKQIIKELDKDDPIFVRADAMITRKQLLKK